MTHRTWRHAPAGILKQLQPLFLDDELDRVIDIHRNSSFELERSRLFAADYEYPATEIFELKSASLLHGQVYSMNGRISLRSSRFSMRKLLPCRLSKAPSGFIGCSIQTWHSFACWLTDQLATEWLGNNLGCQIFTAERRFHHTDAYRAKLPWHALSQTDCRFERLLLAHDRGHNPSRVARLQALRETLRENWRPIQSYDMVYILSGRTKPKNHLVNEQKIARYVRDQGGLVIQPDEMFIRDITAAFHGAQVVIGVEGEAFAHLLMLGAPTSTLVAIQPPPVPQRFEDVHRCHRDALRLHGGGEPHRGISVASRSACPSY